MRGEIMCKPLIINMKFVGSWEGAVLLKSLVFNMDFRFS
jgi:hypothetical protein